MSAESAVSERLADAACAAGAAPGAVERLRAYGELLLAANARVNLTGAKDWEALAREHLEDALRAAALVPAGLRRFADWGSGAGLPGLVWALARPEWFVHCVERIRKKADFIAAAAAGLGAANVRVHARQLHEILAGLEPRPDAIVARAVEPLDALLERLEGARMPRLPLLWLAGPSWEADAAALAPKRSARWRIEALGRYALAPGRGERTLVRCAPAGGRA